MQLFVNMKVIEKVNVQTSTGVAIIHISTNTYLSNKQEKILLKKEIVNRNNYFQF